MSLKDRIGPPPVRPTGCGVARAAEDLNSDDSQDLYEMVADTRWGADSLRSRLLSEGIKVSSESIGKHRKGICTCAEAKAVTREPEGPRRKR